MSTAMWSAVGCTVAGALIGCLAPSLSDRLAHRRGSSSTERTRRGPTGMARILAAGGATAIVMGLLGFLHSGPNLVAWCWLTATWLCQRYVAPV